MNFHSVECYCQWQLSQCSDSLEAGPYAVCLLAEARYLLSMQTSDQPLARLACSVNVVDPSPAQKHLMYEADFSPRLQMRAVVTVLVVHVCVVYTGTALSFIIDLEV
jgi:hypothetical protein